MYEFILGTVFGVGLILAIQTIVREWNAFNQRRWIRQTNQTIALLDEPSLSEQWSSGEWAQREHEVDKSHELDELRTWGYVEPKDATPCGCHGSWNAHFRAVTYLPGTSTPDTDWTTK